MGRLLAVMIGVGVVVTGCNAGGILVQRVEPGDECPTGGVKLTPQGKPSELVCNGNLGTDGFATLVNQSTVPDDDPRCRRGGIEITTGFDSGADGGVAKDGVLQSGEVLSMSVLCALDDGARIGDLTPPAGAEGSATIKANGGTGTTGNGGAGGRVSLQIQSGTNGGHIKAWRTGQTMANVTIPAAPVADLGPVPLKITSDTTINYYNSSPSLPAGTPYATAEGLFIAQESGVEAKRVTGLSVAAGVTLVLPLLFDETFVIPRSCRIDGTMRGEQMLDNSGHMLGLSCGDIVLSSTSNVVARGTSIFPTIDVRFTARGDVLALGNIDASGFGGVEPGAGGNVTVSAEARLFAGGLVRSLGGDGTVNPGGGGGRVLFTGALGLSSEASIEAHGGSTIESGLTGGAAGSVSFMVTMPGASLRNHGAISARGGSSPGPKCGSCVGGRGGQISLASYNGAISNDGQLSALGGTGVNQGGVGGTISAGMLGSRKSGGHGSLLFSGSIDVSGGNGLVGGEGGAVLMTLTQAAAVGAEIVLLGYNRIEANGATGAPGGGGGTISFSQVIESKLPNSGPAGAVINTVDLSANAGDATGSNSDSPNGGQGGLIQLTTQDVVGVQTATWEVLRNAGTLSAKGGSAVYGGVGGRLNLRGRVSAETSGRLDVHGGAGTAVGGGAGGSIYVAGAEGRLVISNTVDASGGDAPNGTGQGAGGHGGSLMILGRPSTVSATMLAAGGAGDSEIGRGGNGGSVWIHSTNELKSSVTSPSPAGIVVSGGVAKTQGNAGAVIIDGYSVADAWTD